jgi:hypothetical protein
VKYKLEWTWKELSVAYFETLFRKFPVVADLYVKPPDQKLQDKKQQCNPGLSNSVKIFYPEYDMQRLFP